LNPSPHHQRRAFVLHLVSEPGTDAIRSLRTLLKFAGRRLGLRCVDVRECALPAQEDERARALTGRTHMSAFSDRIRDQKTGTFKVADFESGPQTFTIRELLESVKMFNKNVDLLCFNETERQFQLNLTNAEWLIKNLGDDPETWIGKRVTLYLASFEFEGETKQGIRLKLPGAVSGEVLLPEQTRGRSSNPKRNGDRRPDPDDGIPF
jgi:hypothetical protein